MSNKCLKNVIDNRHLLKSLATNNKKLRKVIIENSPKGLIEAICSCILNTLGGNIKLTDEDKKHLVKYKNILRKLTNKSTLKEKRKILVQKGGFLQFLFPAVITGISSIVSSIISSNKSSEE